MWFLNNEPLDVIPDTAIGFVYCITNKTSNKKYIGKKLFHASKFIQRNKKRKRIKVESNWKEYYGSNETLKTLVEEFGAEEFHREILHICYSKSQASYLEAKEQFHRDVILSDEYYNDWISVKVTRKHLLKFQL
jgi:hypothetical protein